MNSSCVHFVCRVYKKSGFSSITRHEPQDICWKTIQRYLKTIAGVQDSAIRSKKDLFREAARLALVQSAEAWIGHYEARNVTSQSYNARMAQQVFERAQLFLVDAKSLLAELQNDD